MQTSSRGLLVRGFVLPQVCLQKGWGERLEGGVGSVPGIQWKAECRTRLLSSLSQHQGTTRQTNSLCTAGGVFVRAAPCEARSTLRTWLTHALLPALLYSPHPHLLTSVSNYSPLSLAQCLSSESLWKGRGKGWFRCNKAANTRSIKIRGESGKRQVQAGLLVIECCGRWGTEGVAIPLCAECHVVFLLS